jgi:hypothetical protein
MVYLEVLIGGLAAFLLGFGWYTALFGKIWQAESGVTDEQAQSGMAMTHGLAFVMMCVISFNINTTINYHALAEQTFVHGALHGVLAAGFIAVPAVAIHYLYQKKSLKLFLIDAGYVLAFFALSGGVMAALKL